MCLVIAISKVGGAVSCLPNMNGNNSSFNEVYALLRSSMHTCSVVLFATSTATAAAADADGTAESTAGSAPCLLL